MEKSNGTMSSMMNMMMMSQMFNGGNVSGFNPMMFMFMNNSNEGNLFSDMFEGAFNFGEIDEAVEEE